MKHEYSTIALILLMFFGIGISLLLAFDQAELNDVCDEEGAVIMKLNGIWTCHNLSSYSSSTSNSFNIIVLPDTQFYSQNYPELFTQQVNWILANQGGISIVLHNGDVVDNNLEAQYNNANNSLTPLIESDIPFLIGRGNHDGSLYNDYFPTSRFDIDGSYGGMNNSFLELEVRNSTYLFISLNYYPSEEELNWAKEVLDNHSNMLAFISTHSCLETDGNLSGSGTNIWNALSSYDNVIAVFCGHNHGEARAIMESDSGKPINWLLADYQTWDYGGNGWLRIYTFSPETRFIKAQTYSTNLSIYNRSDASDFVVGLVNGGGANINNEGDIYNINNTYIGNTTTSGVHPIFCNGNSYLTDTGNECCALNNFTGCANVYGNNLYIYQTNLVGSSDYIDDYVMEYDVWTCSTDMTSHAFDSGYYHAQCI